MEESQIPSKSFRSEQIADTALLVTGNGRPPQSKLEQRFEGMVHDEALKPLLPTITGVVRFNPSERISVSQALELLRLRDREARRSPSGER